MAADVRGNEQREPLRVRVKAHNIEMVAEVLRASLCGVSFTYIDDNPTDLGYFATLRSVRLDKAKGRDAIEVLGSEKFGLQTAAGLRFHYDPASVAAAEAANVYLFGGLATDQREPLPDSDDPELRIDRRPILTAFDNLVVFREDDLLEDASTQIFLLSSGIDWETIMRVSAGPEG